MDQGERDEPTHAGGTRPISPTPAGLRLAWNTPSPDVARVPPPRAALRLGISRLAQEARVPKGDHEEVGEGLPRGDIIELEGREPVALEVERAHDLAPLEEGDHHLGGGARDVRV